jgi:hypothetical protein
MDVYQGSVYDPVSLHKYLYCGANPVMYIDPSGYMKKEDIAVTFAINTVISKSAMLYAAAALAIFNSVIALINPQAYSSLGTELSSFISGFQTTSNGSVQYASSIDNFIKTYQSQNDIIYNSTTSNVVESSKPRSSTSTSIYVFGGSGTASPMPPNDPNFNKKMQQVKNSNKLDNNELNRVLNNTEFKNAHKFKETFLNKAHINESISHFNVFKVKGSGELIIIHNGGVHPTIFTGVFV